MALSSCGCTRQSPTCERGKKLFAAAAQAFQALGDGTATIAGDELWAAYTLAHLAYIDHLRGWWEGDIKIQRGMDAWMISIRLCGRWIFHFGTQDESLVREWLQVRGYQQFVGKGEHAKDRLSGYYRKGAAVEGNMSPLLSSEQMNNTSVPDKHMGQFAEQEFTLGIPSQTDLKTQVAIYIALLVARIPHALTVVEGLFVQRRAANLLRAREIQVGPQDEWTLRELIDEAVQQKERMNDISKRNTQELQE
jgi:hypothetical protein